MPKVSFELNKKIDKRMISVFIGTRQGGIDFSDCVFGVLPKLKKVLSIKGKDRKEEISNFVDAIYKRSEKLLNKQSKAISLRWQKTGNQYFKLVKKIFKLEKLPQNHYIGYLSIINCCPRFLDSKSFQVFYRRPKDSIYVAMHEIIHFFFYDYVFENCPEFKNLDPNQGILWELAEVFNSVILSQPEFKRLHGQKRDWSYPDLRKHLPELKQYWEESSDLDNWIKRAFKYLKNNYGT